MKRTLFVALVVVSVVVGAGGLLFAFGTPQSPGVAAQAVAPGDPGAGKADQGGDDAPAPAPAPAMGGVPAMGGGDPSARGKQAPPADPESPLAIEIPGCVCHSDDPVLVEEHAGYRMNQCFGCHSGGSPSGG